MEGATLMKNTPAPDFQSVFRTCYPKVVRQITCVTGSISTAEDIAQEVFLRLYHSDWTQINNLNAWLTRCSFNAACNYLRGEKRRLAREKLDYQMNIPTLKASEVLEIDDLIIQEETRSEVFEALTAMEERDRILLLLKYQGYSYRETAEILEIAPASIGTLLARARKQFKTHYERIMNKGGKRRDVSI